MIAVKKISFLVAAGILITAAFLLAPMTAHAAATPQVVIYEVRADDSNGGNGWIEIANLGAEEQDVSGMILETKGENGRFVIPSGTTIPMYGFLVLKHGRDFDFSLDQSDSIRLLASDGKTLVSKTTWTAGDRPSWGLDTNAGMHYRSSSEATPGAENRFEEKTSQKAAGSGSASRAKRTGDSEAASVSTAERVRGSEKMGLRSLGNLIGTCSMTGSR
ncbi:MAG: lamin tail domain-containing protein [Anaerovoracaceae bacterium]|jgi:hypothetical protein